METQKPQFQVLFLQVLAYNTKLLNLAQYKSEHMRNLHKEKSIVEFRNVQNL